MEAWQRLLCALPCASTPIARQVDASLILAADHADADEAAGNIKGRHLQLVLGEISARAAASAFSGGIASGRCLTYLHLTAVLSSLRGAEISLGIPCITSL